MKLVDYGLNKCSPKALYAKALVSSLWCSYEVAEPLGERACLGNGIMSIQSSTTK